MLLRGTNKSGLTHLGQLVALVILIIIMLYSISRNSTRMTAIETKYEAIGLSVDSLINADNLDHWKLSSKMDTIIYNQNIDKKEAGSAKGN